MSEPIEFLDLDGKGRHVPRTMTSTSSSCGSRQLWTGPVPDSGTDPSQKPTWDGSCPEAGAEQGARDVLPSLREMGHTHLALR